MRLPAWLRRLFGPPGDTLPAARVATPANVSPRPLTASQRAEAIRRGIDPGEHSPDAVRRMIDVRRKRAATGRHPSSGREGYVDDEVIGLDGYLADPTPGPSDWQANADDTVEIPTVTPEPLSAEPPRYVPPPPPDFDALHSRLPSTSPDPTPSSYDSSGGTGGYTDSGSSSSTDSGSSSSSGSGGDW